MGNNVARAGKDTGNKSILITGSLDVFVNDASVVFETSPNAIGNIVVTSNVGVFVNDKGIGAVGSILDNGSIVETGSIDVFV